jgi:Tol biopolymer transport system component
MTGLWIYDLDKSELLKVLNGRIGSASWSPKGTDLAFCLGPPHFEIWSADLDPNVSAIEALGPGQTPDEHYREMLAFYTRRIESDPKEVYAYYKRAHYYDCLNEREKAVNDLRRCSAILGGRSASNYSSATPRKIRRFINGPFGYQLIFSIERCENGTQVPCIAFGQKGRSTMKSFKFPILSMSLLGLCLLSGLDTSPAYADLTFGEPTNLGSAVNSGESEGAPCISSDERTLYFAIVTENNDSDLFVSTRETKEDEWGPPVTLGPIVNSPQDDLDPHISPDGLELFFKSKRPGGDVNGRDDIWVARRASLSDEWSTPVNLGSKINTDNWETTPYLSQDGLTLYFTSGRYNEFHHWEATDLYVAHRNAKDAPWEQSVNMGPVINDYSWEYYPSVSPDELALLFASDRNAESGYDLWMTSRATVNSEWGLPTNLGSIINTESNESCPNISRDGKTLFFASDRPGGHGNWDICGRRQLFPPLISMVMALSMPPICAS